MMEPLAGKAGQGALAQWMAAGALLAFDFDGTLAPIVSDPAQARLRVSTWKLLRGLAERHRCAVISGRMREDVQRRLEGLPLQEVAGNHGLEPWFASARFERDVRRWWPLLEERLSRFPGVSLEDKRFSIAVHYRQAPRKRQVLAAIRQAAAALGQARLLTGKLVANVLPERAPHKGIALERLCSQLGMGAAIYVGDDETDEDVFGLAWPGLLSIRVGFKQTSRARFYVRDQMEVDTLLRRLDGLPLEQRKVG